MKKLTIIEQEIFNENANLYHLGGCAGDGDVGLNSFYVNFIVDCDGIEYRICFIDEERNDGLKNYDGWEMTLHEAEENESHKLLEVLEGDWEHEIFLEMEKKAQELAKIQLEELKINWIDEQGFPEKINSLSELIDFIRAFKEIDNEDSDKWAVSLLEERYKNIVFHGYEYDATSLPKFGGDEPASTVEIWSWDENHLLIGRSSDDFEVVPRFKYEIRNASQSTGFGGNYKHYSDFVELEAENLRDAVRECDALQTKHDDAHENEFGEDESYFRAPLYHMCLWEISHDGEERKIAVDEIDKLF